MKRAIENRFRDEDGQLQFLHAINETKIDNELSYSNITYKNSFIFNESDKIFKSQSLVNILIGDKMPRENLYL